MRLVLIGTEYAGKSTLAQALNVWGRTHGHHFHMDDHFTIPDNSLQTAEQRAAAWNLPALNKERFQRFQIYYHLRLLHKYDDIILVGFQIEEAIYGPRYYYPGMRLTQEYHRQVEDESPKDTILVLLTAWPEVLRARMAASPHEYQVVPDADVEAVQEAFEFEWRQSWFRHKIRIDTSDSTSADALRQTFLTEVNSHLRERDLLLVKAYKD